MSRPVDKTKRICDAAMKIGFTERGDAAQDLSWADACLAGKVNGVVAITKDCTSDPFWDSVIQLHGIGFPVIVHATITGWGGTAIEPNVPTYQETIQSLSKIVGHEFPADHVVLRIDPIFPTKKGLSRARDVILAACECGIIPACRCRVSVLDEYPHVKERFRAAGWPACYPGNEFQASEEQFKAVADMLGAFQGLQRDGYRFETCAEPMLQKHDATGILEPCGCLSQKDLAVMGLALPEDQSGRPKQRESCLCLPFKTELLKNKTRCPHQCAYCYWKD